MVVVGDTNKCFRRVNHLLGEKIVTEVIKGHLHIQRYSGWKEYILNGQRFLGKVKYFAITMRRNRVSKTRFAAFFQSFQRKNNFIVWNTVFMKTTLFKYVYIGEKLSDGFVLKEIGTGRNVNTEKNGTALERFE